MKLVIASLASLLGIAFFAHSSPPQRKLTLVFTSDIRGYLSPCGCTKPQIGGVKRMAAVVRALTQQPKTFYLDGGNWTEAVGRQDELKAEALVELFRSLNAVILNVGPLDQKLGSGILENLFEVSGHALASSYDPDRYQPYRIIDGDVCIQATHDDSELSPVSSDAKVRVLLHSGDQASAAKAAQANPDVSLIIYSSQGDPVLRPIRVGNCTLISVGDHCKFVGSIDLADGKWENFRTVRLSDAIADDRSAASVYQMYLRRVGDENLLADVARTKADAKFVGSKACMSCHSKVYDIWKQSAHAAALKTLEATHNDRDPECVSCHVVGLTFDGGFSSRATTPNLAAVGCESCHGPGGNHVKNVKLPYGKAGENSCKPCHQAEHSPDFDFKRFWKKVQH